MTLDELESVARLRAAVPFADADACRRVLDDAAWRQRRSRRYASRSRAAVVLVALALVVVPTALAFGGRLVDLLASRPPQLPVQADRAHVHVVLEPRTGRVVAQFAPWRGHDGICFVLMQRDAGCARRSGLGVTVVMSAFGEWGYTFDSSVASAEGFISRREALPLRVVRLPSPLNVVFFYGAGRAHLRVQAVLLLDRRGRAVFPHELDFRPPKGR